MSIDILCWSEIYIHGSLKVDGWIDLVRVRVIYN
jgi:hypothetical protein